MTAAPKLPPGQRAAASFPRFGLTPFARRFPSVLDRVELRITGDVGCEVVLSREFGDLARIEQRSDFHCVTTWSCLGLVWSGYRFRDVFHQLVVPLAAPAASVRLVVLRGQDGYRTSLPLEYLLADDVLLADRLAGNPLDVAHGAPLRLVAPRHYGYKSMKHLERIELRPAGHQHRTSGWRRFMDHPTARVALEERGRGCPGVVLRHLYRPMIGPNRALFERALADWSTATGRTSNTLPPPTRV